jgi:hypothetical protein
MTQDKTETGHVKALQLLLLLLLASSGPEQCTPLGG